MADFVIIGGGVYGTACAWHLARAGADVVVLERKTVASGASGGPGQRGVRANGRDVRELPLMRAAYPIWETLSETLGEPGLFQRTGNLMLIEREQDLARAAAQAMLQNRHGIETVVLDAVEVRELEPLAHPAILGGVFCPADGVSDHARTTRAYARAAGQAGADIREATEATRIIYGGDRATGVATADGQVVDAAQGVLILTNWSAADLVGDRAEIPVWSDAYQVLVSQPLADVPVRHVVGHASRALSLKAEAGSRLMISGGHIGYYDRTTDTGTALEASIEANVADAIAVYPSLAGIEIDIADAGHLESVCIDQIPIIDRVPGTTNAWFACGWSGHGWAIAPAVAEMLANHAAGADCPDLLRPFALSRLG